MLSAAHGPAATAAAEAAEVAAPAAQSHLAENWRSARQPRQRPLRSQSVAMSVAPWRPDSDRASSPRTTGSQVPWWGKSGDSSPRKRRTPIASVSGPRRDSSAEASPRKTTSAASRAPPTSPKPTKGTRATWVPRFGTARLQKTQLHGLRKARPGERAIASASKAQPRSSRKQQSHASGYARIRPTVRTRKR